MSTSGNFGPLGLATSGLPCVQAPLKYLAPDEKSARVLVYPPSSGIPTVRPREVTVTVAIHDGRPSDGGLRLDAQGFELYTQATSFTDYYDARAVESRYYPEVSEVVQQLTGALFVLVYDHNVRSAVRAARGEPGVREPVDQVHNDYTIASGPKRMRQILDLAGRQDLVRHPFAFVNAWRPITGPVLDNPLALCDAQSVAPEDLVPTEIQHFGEGSAAVPRHRGEIYSVRHAPQHRWFYYSEMKPDEILLLKGYDSRADGRARFVPHTGFIHPNRPASFVPRESIEARALVVFESTLAG
jgi:hypothetical protein